MPELTLDRPTVGMFTEFFSPLTAYICPLSHLSTTESYTYGDTVELAYALKNGSGERSCFQVGLA